MVSVKHSTIILFFHRLLLFLKNSGFYIRRPYQGEKYIFKYAVKLQKINWITIPKLPTQPNSYLENPTSMWYDSKNSKLPTGKTDYV